MAGRVIICNNEWMLLHEATKLGDLKLITILVIELKANINHQEYNEMILLYVAVENNHPEAK
ncbi:hypothetical protein BC938DRAFT_483683 [Jimgerdemannia flammicorona]|uniref:Ankyrin repeat-containing domain protein n=1 Tax=Jimgerdemannia flammicorona TaxID=994334 RepID=A0A433QVT9_9FUNG|nr:hypothetical protein BC938DRAFT_483683 [Jimgerdemannia flammicorona]